MTDPLRDDYVAYLEAENDELRERIRQLEARPARLLPVELCLSAHEEALIRFLLGVPEASKERLLTALYGNKPDGDEPDIKIVDVFVCKARKKLAKFGIEVTTLWGRGYALPPKSKALIRAMQEAASAAE